MPSKQQSLADLLDGGVPRPAAFGYAQSLNPPIPQRNLRQRNMPRRMRDPEIRAVDENPGVREQALGDLVARRDAERDLGTREAQGPASNQFADAGMVALETTGVPALRRSYDAFEAGDPRQGIYEGIWGSLGLAGTLGAIPGARGRGVRAPALADAVESGASGGRTSIYRGINQEYDAERAAMLGDRWWHTNPEVASSYAPGGEGAHVIPGTIDENALRLAHIEAPPGTMYSSVPLDSLPADIRRAFPRGATRATTHEVAAAAEAAGYDGVTFSGVRDSTFAGADGGAYPGFGTGDEGRVVALFNDRAVASPFGQAVSPASHIATREGPPTSAPDAGSGRSGQEVTLDVNSPNERSYNSPNTSVIIERQPGDDAFSVSWGLRGRQPQTMVERAGIELPMMYRLGYSNANCIGCVKGGMGYWNKIRRDFPAEFEELAEAQHFERDGCLADAHVPQVELPPLRKPEYDPVRLMLERLPVEAVPRWEREVREALLRPRLLCRHAERLVGQEPTLRRRDVVPFIHSLHGLPKAAQHRESEGRVGREDPPILHLCRAPRGRPRPGPARVELEDGRMFDLSCSEFHGVNS
jgi:hypothetical protein